MPSGWRRRAPRRLRSRPCSSWMVISPEMRNHHQLTLVLGDASAWSGWSRCCRRPWLRRVEATAARDAAPPMEGAHGHYVPPRRSTARDHAHLSPTLTRLPFGQIAAVGILAQMPKRVCRSGAIAHAVAGAFQFVDRVSRRASARPACTSHLSFGIDQVFGGGPAQECARAAIRPLHRPRRWRASASRRWCRSPLGDDQVLRHVDQAASG